MNTGIDGTTAEMVLVCEEVGVKYLWRNFDVAWYQREVPND